MASSSRSGVPAIGSSDDFDVIVSKLARYITRAIAAPYSFEELRTAQYSHALQPLVTYLVDDVDHPATVHALLALKGHFSALEGEDDRGITATRALACELVAWRFVTHLSERDAIDHLCTDLVQNAYTDRDESQLESTEESPLLSNDGFQSDDIQNDGASEPGIGTISPTDYQHLNALEIAAVCEAKKFMSQRAVQSIIDGLWKGDIMLWQTMNPDTVKRATLYRSEKCDPFTRLRVPLYLKTFEVMFFAAFLAFYYVVLVEKSFHSVTFTEVLLYIWLAAFAYNEFVELLDAGFKLYAADFWAVWDLGIIAVGLSFFIARMIGLSTDSRFVTDTAFDIIALEALLLVPRICSLLSLHPYFGTLLPCLKEMTKDFVKFLALVFILYLGFNTTFGFLARGTFTFREMSWILIKVFFGSSYLGFDVAEKISPTMGPPLMLVFCVATNFLLLTILICLLSKSYDKVMEHARDEYLFVYSVYVLEASSSNRLTFFLPPLNLLPLLLRPLKLFAAPDTLRACRIALLKATHWPLVALILAYESGRRAVDRRTGAGRPLTASIAAGPRSALMRRPLSSRSVQTRLNLKVSASPPSEPSHSNRSGSEQDPGRVQTLETLARSLREQLQAIESLIERERGQDTPA